MNQSLLFSDVKINSYSLVEKSVLLPDVVVGRHCRINRAIIDRGSHIEDNTQIGVHPDIDRERGFRVTDTGITLVTPDMLGQDLHFTR